MVEDLGDLGDLYQQVILDHGRRPRNHHAIEGADGEAEGYNPLCGDQVKIFVKLDGDRVDEVGFTGKGCAICTASASVMTQILKNMDRKEAETLFRHFHAMLTDPSNADGRDTDLGKLEAFAGVRNYPIRIKCATLPWHTLKAALENRGETVTTE